MVEHACQRPIGISFVYGPVILRSMPPHTPRRVSCFGGAYYLRLGLIRTLPDSACLLACVIACWLACVLFVFMFVFAVDPCKITVLVDV